MSPRGVHNTAQTAFRLPEGLLEWLREQAEREGDGRTMTDIVTRALERERDRCASPPPLVAAETQQPQQAGKVQNAPKGKCDHRLPSGAYCRTCDKIKD